MDRTIWVLQQFPAKMRYSNWFGFEITKSLEKYWKAFLITPTMDGVGDQDTSKDFQPLYESIVYELRSLHTLHKYAKKNDVIIVLDPSFPGYVVNIRTWFDGPIITYCHATSLNEKDIFENKRQYKWQLEKAFLSSCNVVLVATQYHKQKLRNGGLKTHIEVIGFPFPKTLSDFINSSLYHKQYQRNGRILVPSRQHSQKIDLTVYNQVKSKVPIDIAYFDNWTDYYVALMTYGCVASFAVEETFGIAPAEALALGTPVLVPDALSYSELYNSKYKYRSVDEFVSKFHELTSTEHKPTFVFNMSFYDDLCQIVCSV